MTFVGVGRDGDALIVECDGEHFRLPLDDRLHEAVVSGGTQLAIPVENPLSPREIQDRIRHGTSSAQLAEITGMPVERIARFEGPVLAERAHQARSARTAVIDGRQLETVVAEFLALGGIDAADAHWDAWRRDDGSWLVTVQWSDAERPRRARWSWTPRTRRLLPVDQVSHTMLRGAGESDDLTAVLRPVRPVFATPPRPQAVPDVEPEHLTPPEPDLLDAIAEEEQEAGEQAAADAAEPDEDARTREPVRPRPAKKSKRVSIPTWEEIATGRRADPDA